MWLVDKIKEMEKKHTKTVELSKQQEIDNKIEDVLQQMRDMQNDLNKLSVKHRELLKQKHELETK